MTGPEALTLSDAAEKFSKVLGREIRYVAQPVEEFGKILTQLGLPEWRVNAVCDEFRLLGERVRVPLNKFWPISAMHTTSTIRHILGRDPTSLEQFIKDHLEVYTAG